MTRSRKQTLSAVWGTVAAACLIGCGAAYAQSAGGGNSNARAQAVYADWRKLTQKEIDCFDQTLRTQRSSLRGVIERGIAPNDPSLAQIRTSCRTQARAPGTARSTSGPNAFTSLDDRADDNARKTAAERAAAEAAAEKALADKVAAEIAAVKKAAAQKAAVEKLAAEKLAAEKAAARKIEEEKAAAEKLAAEEAALRAAEEKAAADKLAAEEAASKAAEEKAEAERLAADEAATQKMAEEKAAANKLAAEKSTSRKPADERNSAAKLAAAKAAVRKAAADKIAADKIAAETAALKAAEDRAEKIVADKIAAQKAAQARTAPYTVAEGEGATRATRSARRAMLLAQGDLKTDIQPAIDEPVAVQPPIEKHVERPRQEFSHPHAEVIAGYSASELRMNFVYGMLSGPLIFCLGGMVFMLIGPRRGSTAKPSRAGDESRAVELQAKEPAVEPANAAAIREDRFELDGLVKAVMAELKRRKAKPVDTPSPATAKPAL